MATIEFDVVPDSEPYWRHADYVLGNRDLSSLSDSFWYEHDTDEFPSNEYVEAFVDGAREVWEKVAKEL